LENEEIAMADGDRRSSWFDTFASASARWAGHAGAFAIAFGFVLFWALSGPIFGFSNTWQLVINTATTVLTFLMVFVIQNTINRDSMAVHLKLDELLRVSHEAHDALIGAERLSEKEIGELERQEVSAARQAEARHNGDAGAPSDRQEGGEGDAARSRR
jgi:low affinity Fe/Cu permease